MSTSLDVSEVFTTAKVGPSCWRQKIEAPEAEEYLVAVERYMQDTGKKPTWTRLADKLTALGLEVADQQVARHYGGRCRCPR